MQVKSKPTRRDEPTRPGRVALLDSLKRTLRDTRAELRKVTWPTREQVVRLTVVVSAASFAVGVFLGAVDYFFEVVFKVVLGGG